MKVANMARRYQNDLEYIARQNKQKLKMLSWSRVQPKFFTESKERRAILKSDDEIFDFTDSRLIRPPSANRYNFPLVDIRVNNQKSEDPLVQISYSFDPVNLSNLNNDQQTFRKPRYYFSDEGKPSSLHSYPPTSSTNNGRDNVKIINCENRIRLQLTTHDYNNIYLRGNQCNDLKLRKHSPTYPYHIFDKSRSVAMYNYPFDESKFLFRPPVI